MIIFTGLLRPFTPRNDRQKVITRKRGFAPLTKKHSFFRSNFCPEIVTFWLKLHS